MDKSSIEDILWWRRQLLNTMSSLTDNCLHCVECNMRGQQSDPWNNNASWLLCYQLCGQQIHAYLDVWGRLYWSYLLCFVSVSPRQYLLSQTLVHFKLKPLDHISWRSTEFASLNNIGLLLGWLHRYWPRRCYLDFGILTRSIHILHKLSLIFIPFLSYSF